MSVAAPMSVSRRWALAALLALTAPAVAQQAAPAPHAPPQKADVLFFAAASLQTALNAVAAAWQKDSGKSVAFSYAASSALVRQLEQGAPADLFASADPEWMDYAQSRDLIRAQSRITLLGNTLVLIGAKDNAASLRIAPGFDLAGALGEERLATGNPASVPAGKYARAALTQLGVWQAVGPKIAGTDNVRAALALVARGEARYGIVYATDAASDPGVRVVDTFPASTHPTIAYPFALTKGANEQAAAFLAYLRSPPAARIFEEQGFVVLK